MHSNLFAPPRSKSLCLLCFLPHAVPRSACVHILLRIFEVFLSSVIAPVSSSRSRDIVSLCARFSSPAHKRQTVDNLFSSFLILLSPGLTMSPRSIFVSVCNLLRAVLKMPCKTSVGSGGCRRIRSKARGPSSKAFTRRLIFANSCSIFIDIPVSSLSDQP